MGFSKKMALEEEEAAFYEKAYIDAERAQNVNKLFDTIFGDVAKTNIVKVSRKEAKKHYLYKRLDGTYKLV